MKQKIALFICVAVLAGCNDFDAGDLYSAPQDPPAISSLSPGSGPKETVVEITGSNFGQNPNEVFVTFNNDTAVITFVSDTLLVAEVPVGAGTGPVKVAVYNRTADGPVFNYLLTTTVSTLAGSGLYANDDGTGTDAGFNGPAGIDVDANGNIYVADLNNHRIRKVTPQGVVTTIAGNTQGYQDGKGNQALFNTPYDVAYHTNGNLYVSDALNNRIRRIDAQGNVTTFAGSDEVGLVDATGTAARFFGPASITATAGDLYVTDLFNHAIRRITPAAVVQTWAGTNTPGFVNGTRAAARFNAPSGITADVNEDLYVTEWNNHAVRKVTSAAVSTVAGTGSAGYTNGAAASAKFNGPNGAAIDAAGVIFVADRYNHCIRKIAGGQVSTYAGTTAEGFYDGPGNEAQFSQPTDVAIGADGALYVADFGGNRVRKIVTE